MIDNTLRKCNAKTKKGTSCKNSPMKNSDYCYIHSFGKLKGSPLYKNPTMHFIIAIALTVILFVFGPSRMNQEMMLESDKITHDKLSTIEDIIMEYTSLESLENTWYRELVARVIQTLGFGSTVEVGSYIIGPDGIRDIDIEVRGKISGEDKFVAIQCVDLPKNKKVGIDIVDAFDSKRKDLDADYAIICSNNGFDQIAMRKAKRTGIGLISLLKSGDSQMKTVIEEEIYTRKIRILSLNSTLHLFDEKQKPFIRDESDFNKVLFEGKPFNNWIVNESIMIVNNNYRSKLLISKYNFKEPLEFCFKDKTFYVTGYDLQISYETKWFFQNVVLDASLGLYDYLNKSVHIAGSGEYIIKGVNPDFWQPINFIPSDNQLWIGGSIIPNELHVLLSIVEGMPASIEDVGIPEIDKHIADIKLEKK